MARLLTIAKFRIDDADGGAHKYSDYKQTTALLGLPGASEIRPVYHHSL